MECGTLTTRRAIQSPEDGVSFSFDEKEETEENRSVG
jgi:hypothetical protein